MFSGRRTVLESSSIPVSTGYLNAPSSRTFRLSEDRFSEDYCFKGILYRFLQIPLKLNSTEPLSASFPSPLNASFPILHTGTPLILAGYQQRSFPLLYSCDRLGFRIKSSSFFIRRFNISLYPHQSFSSPSTLDSGFFSAFLG